MPSSPPGPFSLSYCLAQHGPSLARPNSHAPPAQQLAALPTDPAVPMASLAILPSPRCFEQAFPTRAVTILYPVCSLTPVTHHRQPPTRQVPSHSLAPAHHQPSVFSLSTRPSKARPSRPHSLVGQPSLTRTKACTPMCMAFPFACPIAGQTACMHATHPTNRPTRKLDIHPCCLCAQLPLPTTMSRPLTHAIAYLHTSTKRPCSYP